MQISDFLKQLNVRILVRACSFFVGVEYFLLFASANGQRSAYLPDLFLLGMFYALSVRLSQLDYLNAEKNGIFEGFLKNSVYRAIIFAITSFFLVSINLGHALLVGASFLGFDQLRRVNHRNFASDILLLLGFIITLVCDNWFSLSGQYLLIFPYFFVSLFSMLELLKTQIHLKSLIQPRHSALVGFLAFAPFFEAAVFNAHYPIADLMGIRISDEFFIAIRSVTAAAFIFPFLILIKSEIKVYSILVFFGVIFLLPLAALFFVNLYFFARGVSIPAWMYIGEVGIFLFYTCYYFYPRAISLASALVFISAWFLFLLFWIFLGSEIWLFVGISIGLALMVSTECLSEDFTQGKR